MQVHRQLVILQQRELRERNKGRKNVKREELVEGNKILVYEFEKADRGILGKLAAK